VSESAQPEPREQLAKEVAALRESAVQSTDPLLVAKAIATSNPGVQQLILERFGANERLVEVLVLQGGSREEVQVFLRFVSSTGMLECGDNGLLVFVDLIKGEVSATVDPFVLQPERRAGRPFVTVAALRAAASAFGIDEKGAQDLVHREQTFFRELGLAQVGGGGLGGDTDTVCDTGVTSTTWSGQPYRPDQTDPETTNDYCDSSGPIVA